ncbi:hypothetical protein [Marinobacter nauticus]
MKNADMHEKWMEKCDVAKKAQDKYNKDPSAENLSELKKALYERGLFEEEMDPDASHSHRP